MVQIDHKREFEANGFTMYRQLFTPDEMKQLQGAIHDAQQQVGASRLDKSGLLFKHNLYQRNDGVRQFITQQKVVHALREIIGPDFWVRWDQTVDKAPGGEEFPWHQDNGYNGLVDGHFQFWIAMSEMTKDNGGLWVQRGSHRNGPMPHQTVGNHLVCPGNENDAVFVDAEAGDALVFSSFTLHRTAPNITKKPRVAYVVEYMSMKHFDPYIDPPYFVAARHGEPAPGYMRFYRGRLNPYNQLKYFRPRLSRNAKKVRSSLSRFVKKSLGAGKSGQGQHAGM